MKTGRYRSQTEPGLRCDRPGGQARAVREALLVVNPFATRVSEAKLAQVEEELGAGGPPDRRADASIRGTRRELVADACRDGTQAVIVFSGDGGFNEALNGLDGDVPIGFLPGGGTSVLSRALGLPPDPIEAARRLADALVAGRTRRIALGCVNHRRFAFGAGLGTRRRGGAARRRARAGATTGSGPATSRSRSRSCARSPPTAATSSRSSR